MRFNSLNSQAVDSDSHWIEAVEQGIPGVSNQGPTDSINSGWHHIESNSIHIWGPADSVLGEKELSSY